MSGGPAAALRYPSRVLGRQFIRSASVNLNFTAGREAMAAAIERCGLTTILTSRKFITRTEIAPIDGMVFLEDVFGGLTKLARARMLVTAFVLPTFFTDPAARNHALWEQLCLTQLPRLWLPKREDIRFVEAIPSLGTGKVDLRGVRELARAGEAVAS